MKDFIFAEWSENNHYSCIINMHISSNLKFIIDYFENDYKKDDQKIFTQAINIYDTTFVYNDCEKNMMYIGDITLKSDKGILTEKYFHHYINDKNSCKISHKNFIELAENLIRIKINPAPFMVVYRHNHWIFCKAFRFEEEIELFIKIIYEYLPSLHKEINNVFLKIRLCNDLTETNEYFKQLEDIHSFISRLIFEEGINIISDDLEQFFRDFEHIGEISWREYMFHEITKKNYTL